MRIAIVHNFYKISGGEDAIVQEESALLEKRGHEVVRYFAYNNDIVTPYDKLRVAANATFSLRSYYGFQRFLHDKKPDLVHVHNFFPLFSPSVFYASSDQAVPTVLTLHNFRILCPTCFLYHDEQVRERSLKHSCWWTVPKRVYRNSLLGTMALATMVEAHKHIGTWRKKVDKFIALTEFAKTKFVAGGIPEAKILVKGNSISDVPRQYRGSRSGALYVGRLSEEKGIRTLLNAWTGMSYPLTIVGAGPLEDYVRSQAGPNVMMLGSVDRSTVRREMEKAAFLILPSLWYEMFPTVIVEAMAAGLPCIVSDIAAMGSIISNRLNGYTFRVGSPEALREACMHASAHLEEMLTMGANARRTYLERFSPEVNYRSLLKIYEQAVQDRQKLKHAS